MKTPLGYTQLSEFYRKVASWDFSEAVLDNSDAHHSVLCGGRGFGDENLIYAGLQLTHAQAGHAWSLCGILYAEKAGLGSRLQGKKWDCFLNSFC